MYKRKNLKVKVIRKFIFEGSKATTLDRKNKDNLIIKNIVQTFSSNLNLTF